MKTKSNENVSAALTFMASHANGLLRECLCVKLLVKLLELERLRHIREVVEED